VAVTLLFLLTAGLGAYISYPQWRGPLVHAIPQADGYLPPWVSQRAAQVSPPPTAMPAATPSLAPAPTLGSVHLTFTLPPVPVLPAVGAPLPTPTPTPDLGNPAVLMPWSLKDQNWAKDTLGVDSALDLQAAHDYPASAEYYRAYSARWESCLADIKTLEAAVYVQQNVLDECPPWFAMAIGAHQDDTVAVPADKQWNDEWIRNYNELTQLWKQLA